MDYFLKIFCEDLTLLLGSDVREKSVGKPGGTCWSKASKQVSGCCWVRQGMRGYMGLCERCWMVGKCVVWCVPHDWGGYTVDQEGCFGIHKMCELGRAHGRGLIV